MKKIASVRFSHIEPVPVGCLTCRHYSDFAPKPCNTDRSLCRANDFALWEFEDRNAEVLGIYEEVERGEE